MSDKIDLDAVQAEAERLVALLKDRQPGLMSWTMMVAKSFENLYSLIYDTGGKTLSTTKEELQELFNALSDMDPARCDSKTAWRSVKAKVDKLKDEKSHK